MEGRQAFGPFGELIGTSTSTYGYRPLTGYTGHIQTDTTGLIYMRGRYYSPAWHRFVNSDHGIDIANRNQFAYVGGSPFHATDPSGMEEDKKPKNKTMDWLTSWLASFFTTGGGTSAQTNGDTTVVNTLTGVDVMVGNSSQQTPQTGQGMNSDVLNGASTAVDLAGLKSSNPGLPVASIVVDRLKLNNGDISKKAFWTNTAVTTALWGLAKAGAAEASMLGGLVWAEVKWAGQMIDDAATSFSFGFNPTPR